MKQEVYRKMGLAIQADEEHLRVQLEALQAELNAPTQFKVRKGVGLGGGGFEYRGSWWGRELWDIEE